MGECGFLWNQDQTSDEALPIGVSRDRLRAVVGIGDWLWY